MSYSRWGSSSWYTFWNNSSGEDRDTQVLSAWYSMSGEDCIDWQYWELEDLMKESFDEITKRIMIRYRNCSPDEASELQEIMQMFISDVKSDFPLL
jgi:hypothetical protein